MSGIQQCVVLKVNPSIGYKRKQLLFCLLFSLPHSSPTWLISACSVQPSDCLSYPVSIFLFLFQPEGPEGNYSESSREQNTQWWAAETWLPLLQKEEKTDLLFQVQTSSHFFSFYFSAKHPFICEKQTSNHTLLNTQASGELKSLRMIRTHLENSSNFRTIPPFPRIYKRGDGREKHKREREHLQGNPFNSRKWDMHKNIFHHSNNLEMKGNTLRTKSELQMRVCSDLPEIF